MGYPQCGHAAALSETSPLHSGHLIRAMRSSVAGPMLLPVPRGAEHDVLHDFSRLEGNGGAWGSEHATELGDLSGHEAVHGPSNTAFQEAEARCMLELVLQLAQPLRCPADDRRRLRARCLNPPPFLT